MRMELVVLERLHGEVDSTITTALVCAGLENSHRPC